MAWFKKKENKSKADLHKEKAKKGQEARPKQTFLETANSRAVLSSTQVLYTDPSFARPPPLNYSLRKRKKSIAIFWTFIFVDCVLLPIALYFGLWYGTNLSHNAVFSISTGLLGTVSIVEYFIRFRRLWKKFSTCRVIGARRWYLDWFHWNLSVAWIAVMIELIVYVAPPLFCSGHPLT